MSLSDHDRDVLDESEREFAAPSVGARPGLAAPALLRLGAVAAIGMLIVEIALSHRFLGAAVDALGRARPAWVVTALVATLTSMHFFARTQRRMWRAADPSQARSATLPRMVRLAYSANALNMTLPAGSAVSVAYAAKRLRGWGASNAAIVFTLVASGVLSSVTFLALALGYGLLAGSATGAGPALLIGSAGLVVVVFTARRRHRSGRAGHRRARITRWLNRTSLPGARAVLDALDGLRTVHPRRRDWAAGAGAATVNWLADLACLIASCRAVGLTSPTPMVLLAAYVAGMSASSVAFLPGGIGVVEVTMIATLHSGGVPLDPATTAVLLYRLISCVLVVVIGWAVQLVGRCSANPFWC